KDTVSFFSWKQIVQFIPRGHFVRAVECGYRFAYLLYGCIPQIARRDMNSKTNVVGHRSPHYAWNSAIASSVSSTATATSTSPSNTRLTDSAPITTTMSAWRAVKNPSWIHTNQ